MAALADSVPHLALPLRVVGPSFVTVQQDTLEELQTTVAVICSFELGSRIERPEFGIAAHEITQQPVDGTDIEAAVEAYEPRAAIQVTQAAYDPADPTAAGLAVSVTTTTDQTPDTD